MIAEKIETKLGAFGMVCILCSMTMGVLIALGALVSIIYCLLECVF